MHFGQLEKHELFWGVMGRQWGRKAAEDATATGFAMMESLAWLEEVGPWVLHWGI